MKRDNSDKPEITAASSTNEPRKGNDTQVASRENAPSNARSKKGSKKRSSSDSESFNVTESEFHRLSELDSKNPSLRPLVKILLLLVVILLLSFVPMLRVAFEWTADFVMLIVNFFADLKFLDWSFLTGDSSSSEGMKTF